MGPEKNDGNNDALFVSLRKHDPEQVPRVFSQPRFFRRGTPNDWKIIYNLKKKVARNNNENRNSMTKKEQNQFILYETSSTFIDIDGYYIHKKPPELLALEIQHQISFQAFSNHE